MKKLIILSVLLGIGAYSCFAEMNFNEEYLPKRMCIKPSGDTMKTFSYDCSSTSATQVISANSKRIELTIKNTDGSNSVYVSSYAASSISGLYEIGSNTYINEVFGSNAPYIGAVYVLSNPGSTVTIRGVEISYE